jgi:Cdc6-like AAA superfamily ATPase
MLGTLLAIRGTANTGKTTTVKMVYESIRQKYRDLEETRIVPPRWGKEIRVILNINKIKIGIETHGDPNSTLEESLTIFAKRKCKVIICACRTRGRTREAVSEMAPKYRVKWFEKLRTRSVGRQEADNQETAEQIFAELKKAIKN